MSGICHCRTHAMRQASMYLSMAISICSLPHLFSSTWPELRETTWFGSWFQTGQLSTAAGNFAATVQTAPILRKSHDTGAIAVGRTGGVMYRWGRVYHPLNLEILIPIATSLFPHIQCGSWRGLGEVSYVS